MVVIGNSWILVKGSVIVNSTSPLAPGSHLVIKQSTHLLCPSLPSHILPSSAHSTTEMIPPNAAITVAGNLFTADSANGNVPFLFGCLQSRS